jgi:hypothetical protein
MQQLATKTNIDLEAMRLWYKKKHQTIQSTMKKFKTSIAPSLALNLLVTNSSVPDNENSALSNPTSSPFVHTHSQTAHPAQNKCITHLSSNTNASNVITPVKQVASALTADQIHHNFFKGQTPGASSYSLSSPSAAILFGMNSNSFSVPNEVQYSLNTASSRMHVTKTYGNHDDKENKPSYHNVSCTNNASISNIDDVIIETFMNDISYELVQK